MLLKLALERCCSWPRHPADVSTTAAQQQDADEEQSSTLDIELLKEFELIGADSKNDEVNNETVKEETAIADDLLDPEPRARCNTWPRLQYAAATSVVNGGSPVMQVCTIVCTCSTYVLRRCACMCIMLPVKLKEEVGCPRRLDCWTVHKWPNRMITEIFISSM